MVSLTKEQKDIIMMSPKMKELKRKYDMKLKGKGMRGKGKKLSWWDIVGRTIQANTKTFLKNVAKTGKKAYEIDQHLRKSKVISKVADGIEKAAIGLTAFQPELIEFTAPVAGVAEVVKDTAKSIGYGKRMRVVGMGVNAKALGAKPKGVRTTMISTKPKLMIRRDGVFDLSSVPSNVPRVNKRMSGTGVRRVKGKGLPPGTFGTIYSNYGKVKGI